METRTAPRGIRGRIAGLGGGAPLLPLGLLFALNAVDELDRGAFGVLLPEIRDHFGFGLRGATAITAAVVPAGLLFAFPIARLADRRRRKPVALAGATAWGCFALLTGLAPTILVLYLARIGAGLGRAVNSPIHPSMLSDFYPPSTRAKVMSAHRIANPVGQFVAPLIAGFAAAAVGWRVPFYVLAVPTFVVVALAMVKLHEPERTGQSLVEGDVKLREAFRSLWSVPTLRRLWMAFPFIAFVSIGLQPLFALYYNDEFGVGPRMRGVIQAFDGPFLVVGLVVGAVIIDRLVVRDPGRAVRIFGVAAMSIALMIVGMATAPALWVGVVFNYAINILAPILLTGGIVLISLVSPPESRASSFALFEIFSLAGVTSLLLVGIVGEELGIRTGMVVLTPALIIGAAIVVTAGKFANADIGRVYPDLEPGVAKKAIETAATLEEPPTP